MSNPADVRTWSQFLTLTENVMDQDTRFLLTELVKRLKHDHELHEAQYKAIWDRAYQLQHYVDQQAGQIDDLEDQVNDNTSAVENFDIRLCTVVNETAQWFKRQNHTVEQELAIWESRIVAELDKLPVKNRSNYYHSLANFIAGEDIARMKDLFDEIKARVKE